MLIGDPQGEVSTAGLIREQPTGGGKALGLAVLQSPLTEAFGIQMRGMSRSSGGSSLLTGYPLWRGRAQREVDF
ncbi:hypothetical protein QQF64_029796 [Cirrhinus molitorella]|uniref:Uncharacterized protein n=1 Tax=Cirrhinus molitorella TaxID=172907 RepID=A0ABR3N1H6_9TELE